jgi:UDP-glucose:(heptosyl)LPS alpha-1,3-glucosyltransferase
MIEPEQARPLTTQSPRRILFVRQKYSAFGGAELILDRTMTALAARGHAVAVLSADWPDRGDGIAVIRCPTPPVPRAFRAAAFARAARRAFSRELGALVQANQPIPGCHIYRTSGGVHAAYLKRRALTDGPIARAWTASSLFHRNALRLERETFADPHLRAVIANSAMVADEVAEFYGVPRARIHHIANGIDLARFHPGLRTEFRQATRARFGLDQRAPLVLLVGSGYRRKGLSEAIAAVALSEARPHLWVVGRDSRPSAFVAEARRAGIADRFRVFGAQADARPWFGAADLVIMPSWYEPFGIVALEAIACGLPVVVSSATGAREAVEDFDPALVYPVGDRNALARAIDRGLALAARPETGPALRALSERYSLDAMVDRMVAVYEKVEESFG